MVRKSGWRALHERDRLRPELRPGLVERAAPRAQKHVVRHEHRRVAARPSGGRRSPRRLSRIAAPPVGAAVVELDGVAPPGEVRISAVREDAPSTLGGTSSRALARARRRRPARGDPDARRPTGDRGRDGSGRSRGSAARRSSRAAAAAPRGRLAAQRGVDAVAARPRRASPRHRRASASGSACRYSSRQLPQRARDVTRAGAALPDSHQPHGVEAVLGHSRKLGLGNVREADRAPRRAAQRVQPAPRC